MPRCLRILGDYTETAILSIIFIFMSNSYASARDALVPDAEPTLILPAPVTTPQRNAFAAPPFGCNDRGAARPCSKEGWPSAGAPLISASGYPVSAPLVSLAQAANLQALLDQYKTIRIATGDYTQAGPSELIVRSGFKLYGLPGSIVPPIVVAPGTSGAVVSKVRTNCVSFPTSNVTTHDNLFLDLDVSWGPGIAATNASLANNVFMNTTGRINFDDFQSGSIANNRFIRNLFRTGGAAPLLTMIGNGGAKSYNNTFLFSNFLTPIGDSSDLGTLDDLTFVGFDAEAWNYFGQGAHGPISTNANFGTLRLLNVSGGTDGVANSNQTPFAEIGAKHLLVVNDISTTPHIAKINLLSSVQQAAFLNGPPTTSLSNTLAVASSATTVYRAATAKDATVPATNGAVANAVIELTSMSNGGRRGQPWEWPTFDPVPDPAGANWNVNLSAKPDSTDYIQRLINSQSPGIAFLPAGLYYISRPLVMTTTQGLIGAGMDETVIIAKSPSLDIFVGGDHMDTCAGSSLTMTLSDLTLQGGLNGIHHAPNGSGGCSQYYDMFLSHITFRNMRNAGIFEDRIYGYDNNFFDHLNFVGNAYGFLQRPSPTWNGTDPSPGMGYMDKTVFYANQFIGNGLAAALPANRADNLDMWINTLFQNNADGALQLGDNNNPTVANSVFINNGGPAVIATDPTDTNFACVACLFEAGPQGRSMLGGGGSLVDSSFAEAMGAAVISGTTVNETDIYSSTSYDMPVGSITNGFLFDNYFAKDQSHNNIGIIAQNSALNVLSRTLGSTPPIRQYLWGSPLQFRY